MDAAKLNLHHRTIDRRRLEKLFKDLFLPNPSEDKNWNLLSQKNYTKFFTLHLSHHPFRRFEKSENFVRNPIFLDKICSKKYIFKIGTFPDLFLLYFRLFNTDDGSDHSTNCDTTSVTRLGYFRTGFITKVAKKLVTFWAIFKNTICE